MIANATADQPSSCIDFSSEASFIAAVRRGNAQAIRSLANRLNDPDRTTDDSHINAVIDRIVDATVQVRKRQKKLVRKFHLLKGGSTAPTVVDLKAVLNQPHRVRFTHPDCHTGELGTVRKIEPVRGRIRVHIGPEWFHEFTCPHWFVEVVEPHGGAHS